MSTKRLAWISTMLLGTGLAPEARAQDAVLDVGVVLFAPAWRQGASPYVVATPVIVRGGLRFVPTNWPSLGFGAVGMLRTTSATDPLLELGGYLEHALLDLRFGRRLNLGLFLDGEFTLRWEPSAANQTDAVFVGAPGLNLKVTFVSLLFHYALSSQGTHIPETRLAVDLVGLGSMLDQRPEDYHCPSRRTNASECSQ